LAASETDPVLNLGTVVRKDVSAYPVDANGQVGKPYYDVGMEVTSLCPRDPHVVQFVYRTEIDANGKYTSGTFNTSWGTFEYTTDPANPKWHTDGIGYPNPYMDQAPGAPHDRKTAYVNVYDAPAPPVTPNVSWQVTAKDFCICNCKVVRVVNWTRGGHYDPVKLTPYIYTNINIEKPTDSTWADKQLNWVNEHLANDKYELIQDH
jgi:hypothetical protein